MLIHNLTPYLCAAKATSLRPPTPAISVALRATFAIRDDGSLELVTDPLEMRPPSTSTFRDDDDEHAGGAVEPDDFADFKPRAEVLVRATCHAPGGKETRACPAMVKLGDWSKTLRVTGPRTWDQSSARPFTTMPVDWEHAFGGAGYARNPSGKGFDTNEAPNVTRAGDATSRGAEIEPASFGPINARWPQRCTKRGKSYGGDYLKTRAPWFAADFDWTYFLEAPEDQWLDGYLRGDETLVLQNLHPRAAILTVALPAVATRAFIRDALGEFREVTMRLDTVFADLEACRLELSFRGVAEVRDDELDDVVTLLVASEPLGDANTKPRAHYEALAAAFEADPTGTRSMFGGATATPDERPPRNELPKLGDVLDAHLGASRPSALEDLVPLVDAAVAHAASRPEVKKAMAEREVDEGPDEPPPARVSKPGALPYFGLRRRVRAVVEHARDARLRAIEKGAKPEQLEELARAEDRFANDPRHLELDPSYTPPEPLTTCAPGPGADLRDRDLRGADLSGKDLRGANLEGAILTRANLDRADLSGARLHGATLFGARLRQAKLVGADLSHANAAHIDGSGAELRGATVALAFFEGASLDGASFEEAHGEFAIFTRAKLAGARFTRARLSNVELDDTELVDAELVGADLSLATFARSRAMRADFSGATLARASFEGADVTEARFFDATLDRAIFSSAVATRAVFAFARMRRCHMERVVADGADFHAADLFHARLKRASCAAASFTDSNLFSADLRRAVLDKARFMRASLFDAKLGQSSRGGCDFTGAKLARAVMGAE